MIRDRFSVVLVRSKGAFNIGATARAMMNMGFDRLILVNPQTEVDVRAREGAACAQTILARRIVYDSMEEFFANEGEGLRIAFTRRDGLKREVIDFEEYVAKDLGPKLKVANDVSAASESRVSANDFSLSTPIYLIFGSEDDGLNSDEIRFANQCATLKTFGHHGSLNLSQAVLLALFTLQNGLSQYGLAEAKEKGRPIQRTPLEFPLEGIRKWLTNLGLDVHTGRRKNAAEVMANVLLRAIPSKEEIRILSGIFQQTARKLDDRFEPIGFLESDFKSRFGTPRQSLVVTRAKARLKIRAPLQPELSLSGIEAYSHIWLTSIFHENTNKIFRPKVHPPRLEGESIGVFATRSPHRPNPIGLTLAKLDRVEGDTLYLSGVDLIEGTPVLDIKPYLPEVEALPGATSGWTAAAPWKSLDVQFAEDFDQQVLRLRPRFHSQEVSELRDLVAEVISQDPRPTVYRHDDPNDPKYRDQHAIYLGDWNVFFKFSETRARVERIELR